MKRLLLLALLSVLPGCVSDNDSSFHSRPEECFPPAPPPPPPPPPPPDDGCTDDVGCLRSTSPSTPPELATKGPRLALPYSPDCQAHTEAESFAIELERVGDECTVTIASKEADTIRHCTPIFIHPLAATFAHAFPFSLEKSGASIEWAQESHLDLAVQRVCSKSESQASTWRLRAPMTDWIGIHGPSMPELMIAQWE